MTREKPARQKPAQGLQRAVTARWTQKLAEAGWTPICHAFLRHYGSLHPVISPVEAMFVVHLMMHKWDDRNPYPTFATLARQMGVSVSTARGYARSLEKKGYLVRIAHTGDANEFDLSRLFAILEHAVDMAPPHGKRARRPAEVLFESHPAVPEVA